MDNQDMYMVNEVAINWNGALVYALALFLPEGAWPPPQSEVDAGAGSDAGASDAGRDAAGSDRAPFIADSRPPRGNGGGGCGCAFTPATPERWSCVGLALVVLLAVRRRRSRS